MTIQRRPGGGEVASDGARQVIPYGTSDTEFIDAEGDAKLIYTLASYDFGNDLTITGVKITGMERDSKSSSFATFPTQVTDGTKTYSVIGNKATKDSDTYTDDLGLKYKAYTKNTEYLSVSGCSSSDTSIIIPAMITYCEQNTEGTYEIKSKFVASFNCKKFDTVSELTIIIPYLSDNDSYDLNQSFQNKTSLTSVKFIVDNDNPNATHNGEVGYVDIGSAFIGCTNLKTLTLPNVLHRSDYAFAGCISLGSSDAEPLIFNTLLRTAEKDYMFTGCKGLKNLVIGKNVNTIDNIFISCTKDSTAYEGCSGIKVIYNTSTTITESVIASTILQSGSYNVLLFNNPGGEFTQWASVTTDTNSNPTTVTEITMPKGTWTNGISIPAWTHKDGVAWYHSGATYNDCKMTPWMSSTLNFDYSYYYFAFTPTCTVTYHVYQNGSEIGSAVTQEVLCMYNTLLYDKNTYPDKTAQEAMTEDSFTWTSVTGFTFLSGQSVTINGDLDLYLWIGGTMPTTVTITYKWDYIDPTTKTVTTYTYVKSSSPGDYPSVKDDDFKNNATDDQGNKIAGTVADCASHILGWTATDGQTCKNTSDFTSKIYGNSILTPIVELDSSSWKYVLYNSDSSNNSLLFTNTIGNLIIANPNIFVKTGYHFANWLTGNVVVCYPGDEFNTDVLTASWVSNDTTKPEVSVTYNNIDGGPQTVPYTYGDSKTLESSFTRTGQKLVGWSYTESGNVNFSLDTSVTMLNNLRLYAVWEESSEPPTVITDNQLVSLDKDYDIKFIFIGALIDEKDKVEYTVTFYNSTKTPVTKPEDVGVYTIKVGYKVSRDGVDVTKEYYSGYDGNPVTENCNSGLLTIYSGDHASVTD